MCAVLLAAFEDTRLASVCFWFSSMYVILVLQELELSLGMLIGILTHVTKVLNEVPTMNFGVTLERRGAITSSNIRSVSLIEDRCDILLNHLSDDVCDTEGSLLR